MELIKLVTSIRDKHSSETQKTIDQTVKKWNRKRGKFKNNVSCDSFLASWNESFNNTILSEDAEIFLEKGILKFIGS